MKERKVNKFIYWIPRILAIIFIIFLVTMSLDVITEEATIWEIILGMLIHNIPTLILLSVLIISWKYEIVGGIVFNLAGLFYIVMLIFKFNGVTLVDILINGSIISGSAFLIGILFLINWFKKKKLK